MSRRKVITVCLALLVLLTTSLIVLANIAHQKGKRLGILATAKKILPFLEKGPPEGFPITVRTRNDEVVYLDEVEVEFVDAWNPEIEKPRRLRLETDGAGQLIFTSTLDAVTRFEVLKLPKFTKVAAIKDGAPSDNDSYDPRLFGTNLIPPNFYKSAKKPTEYLPLRCRVKITFDTGKVSEGNVTLHHGEHANRICGNSPEGPRVLSLSHIVSIILPKRKGR